MLLCLDSSNVSFEGVDGRVQTQAFAMEPVFPVGACVLYESSSGLKECQIEAYDESTSLYCLDNGKKRVPAWRIKQCETDGTTEEPLCKRPRTEQVKDEEYVEDDATPGGGLSSLSQGSLANGTNFTEYHTIVPNWFPGPWGGESQNLQK